MLNELVIFGASGDLTSRLIAPALVELHAADKVPGHLTVMGVGLEDWSDADFADHLDAAFGRDDRGLPADARQWLLDRVAFRRADVTDPASIGGIITGDSPMVAYLALPPQLFKPTLEALADVGLPDGSVVAIEKPFGHDLQSAVELNQLLRTRLGDVTVFRNDHFLHNQTVQNILGLRFANRIIEPVWRADHIAAVDITWDETLTLEGRAGYYDRAGALRDMLQNHLLQILCFAAMEPPSSMSGTDLHLARESVLRAVSTPDQARVANHTVRARYTAGTIGDRQVPDYADEDGVEPSRHTETFAQATLEIDNWRWAGVPFTLRSGKALQANVAAVTVTFDEVPHSAFAGAQGGHANALRIGLRPPALRLGLNVNAEGELFGLTPTVLEDPLPSPSLSAYAGLMHDVLTGDTALSVSGAEAEQGWRICEPILDAWANDVAPLRTYSAGQPTPVDWDTR